MAVAVDSRVAGMRNHCSFLATCRSLVVVAVCGVVGVSVGDVVSDSVCLIENLNHGASSFHPRLAWLSSSFFRYIASERVHRRAHKATRSQTRPLRTKVGPSNFQPAQNLIGLQAETRGPDSSQSICCRPEGLRSQSQNITRQATRRKGSTQKNSQST